jgi:site-specific DNA recombinase
MQTMKYILYCRKSTDNEDKQVLSLESQTKELENLAEREGLEIVTTMTESKSAKEPGRPVFNEMLTRLSAGEADAILCWKIDRLTRNPVDGGQIQWLLQKGLIKSIRTFERSYSPSDNVLLMSIEQAMATQYLRDLSENVKRGNRTKLERGEWPSYAPFGYKNDRINKTILVDENRAPYIRRAFELYATGGYGLNQVVETLYAEGFRSKTGGKVFKNQIHHFLNSKFYLGLMHRQGKLYQGKHEPLVSKANFDRVQEVLHGRLRPCMQKHFYAARGFLKCDLCGCMITATTAKGRKYYYCTNGKGNCEAHKKYLTEEKTNLLVSKLFQKLDMDEEFIRLCAHAFEEEQNGEVTYQDTRPESIQKELDNLMAKESRLTDTMASGILKFDLYEEKMREIHNARIELKSQLKEMEKEHKGNVTLEQVLEVFLEGSRAAKRYLEVNDREKRNMLEKLLSNASIVGEETAYFQFKSAYQPLALAVKNRDFQKMRAYRVWNGTPLKRLSLHGRGYLVVNLPPTLQHYCLFLCVNMGCKAKIAQKGLYLIR